MQKRDPDSELVPSPDTLEPSHSPVDSSSAGRVAGKLRLYFLFSAAVARPFERHHFHFLAPREPERSDLRRRSCPDQASKLPHTLLGPDCIFFEPRERHQY